MTLINTSILMLFLQPFFVYLALFKQSKHTIEPKSSLDNEDSMFLFIAPGLSVFYLDQFWEALLYLGSVCLLSVLLAKIVESKANKRLTRDDSIGFTLASFIFFGMIKLIIVAAAYFVTDDSTTVTTANLSPPAEEPPLTISQVFIVDYLYSQFWPSLYFLALMVVTLVLKIIEYRFSFKEALSGILIMLSALLVGIFPLFGGAYLLGLIANFFIFFIFCSACIEIDKIGDASGGAIAIFYGYILMMGLGLSVICKLVYEVFF
ncbi:MULTISPECIES: hypothetical protein [unclassified Pseudoalteromonas]|uniref:hypothetical protein n=1 Tax=unclassified Pseudoalteromonas TaxID=194690 RepID=UPI0038687591